MEANALSRSTRNPPTLASGALSSVLEAQVKGLFTQAQGQKWATLLRNHAADIWACDFLQVTDLFFRPLFAFFIIELKSRKVIHVGVT